MKLKTRERYSVRMMIAIAKLSFNEQPVGLGAISQHSGISRRYLEQLVTPLKNALLLKSLSGRGGGYALAREARDIKVGDVIKAAIGPIAVTDCATKPETCIHAEFCSCRVLWALLNGKINGILNEYSLADLIDEEWPKRMQHEVRSVGR